jgi:hypothetical protein
VFTLIVNLGRGKPPGIASTRATETRGLTGRLERAVVRDPTGDRGER